MSRRSAAALALACAGCAVLATVGYRAAAMTGADRSSAGPSAPAPGARPLVTGFLDPSSLEAPDRPVALRNMRNAGATVVRILLHWPFVAPGGETRPSGFVARNPGDPHYQWATIDRELRAVTSKRLSPLIYVQGAPAWAQSGQKQRSSDGPVHPSPSALGDFATALARRYSGNYRGLPQVRYWQVWNEPNLSIQLMPQREGEKPVSPALYRDMVNAMAHAVHAVNSDNVVVAGGLAPFGGDTNDPSGGSVPDQERIHPLEFMRDMLCMSGARSREPPVTTRRSSTSGRTTRTRTVGRRTRRSILTTSRSGTCRRCGGFSTPPWRPGMFSRDRRSVSG